MIFIVFDLIYLIADRLKIRFLAGIPLADEVGRILFYRYWLCVRNRMNEIVLVMLVGQITGNIPRELKRKFTIRNSLQIGKFLAPSIAAFRF